MTSRPRLLRGRPPAACEPAGDGNSMWETESEPGGVWEESVTRMHCPAAPQRGMWSGSGPLGPVLQAAGPASVLPGTSAGWGPGWGWRKYPRWAAAGSTIVPSQPFALCSLGAETGPSHLPP